MARKCDLSGKKPLTGNHVSHANNKTKRRQFPNLITKRFYIEKLGKQVKLKIAKHTLRTIDKIGIETYIRKHDIDVRKFS